MTLPGQAALAKDVLEGWFEALSTFVEVLGQFVLSLFSIVWIVLKALVEVPSDKEEKNDF